MRLAAAASFVATLALAGLGTGAAAQAAGIEVRNAWIPATPAGAPTAAGYATITNHGISSDRLTGGATTVAASVEVHEMSTAGGVMRMRPVAGGLAIGASASVTFDPGRYHLMLMGLKHPLAAGQHVRIVLHFTRAGDVPADFVVKPGGAMAGMHM